MLKLLVFPNKNGILWIMTMLNSKNYFFKNGYDKKIGFIYLKIDKSHLSKYKKDFLNGIFIDKKNLCNYLIQNKLICKSLSKVYNMFFINYGQDVYKMYPYITLNMVNSLSTSMQYYYKRYKYSKKYGKIKRIGESKNIYLCNNESYSIKNNYIRFAGSKIWFKFEGKKQLNNVLKLYNGCLFEKNGNYYIRLKVLKKYEIKQDNGIELGFDFGIKNQITDNFGKVYNWDNFVDDNLLKLIKLQNKFKLKNKRFSNTKQKIINSKIIKIRNKKNELKNKFLNELSHYKLIAIQNDNFKSWFNKLKFRGKKALYNNILPIIKKGLKGLPNCIVINQYYKSTQICPNCGKINKLKLNQRIYKCECGFKKDRDIKAAEMILKKAKEEI